MYKKHPGGQAHDKFECEKQEINHPEGWKVRPCEWYREEYSHCNNFFQKFNQRFIYGKSLDCSQWITDYQNCLVFRHMGDENFLEKVIQSENKRIEKFENNAKANDVWNYRDNPPPNWNRQLPDWWYQKVMSSRLERYIDSLKEEENQ